MWSGSEDTRVLREQVILTASLVARHAGGPTMKNTTDAAGRPVRTSKY